jgi:plasmid maintenance system antidote protein VapI
MSPAHAQLSVLLQEAAEKLGGQSALARATRLTATEINNLILGKRHVTIRQALHLEDVLDVSAEDLWQEACIEKGRQAFTKARAKKK